METALLDHVSFTMLVSMIYMLAFWMYEALTFGKVTTLYKVLYVIYNIVFILFTVSIVVHCFITRW